MLPICFLCVFQMLFKCFPNACQMLARYLPDVSLKKSPVNESYATTSFTKQFCLWSRAGVVAQNQSSIHREERRGGTGMDKWIEHGYTHTRICRYPMPLHLHIEFPLYIPVEASAYSTPRCACWSQKRFVFGRVLYTVQSEASKLFPKVHVSESMHLSQR